MDTIHPPSTFYAVDTLLSNAQAVFDLKSNFTSNGVVVSGLKNKSVISFSGDFTSAYKGKLEIWYANGESGVGEMRVKINQVVKETIRLEGTGGEYRMLTMDVELPAERSFVTLLGGGGAVRIERMTLGESGAGKG